MQTSALYLYVNFWLFLCKYLPIFFHQVSLCPLLPLKKDEKSIKVDQKMYLKTWKKGTNSMLLQTLT